MPITYHVLVPCGRDDDGNLVPLEPAEAPNADTRQAGTAKGLNERRCSHQGAP